MTDPDVFLIEREVAERLRVSTMTVRRLREAGELPFVRVGGQVRFRPGDVDAYIDAQTVDASTSGSAS